MASDLAAIQAKYAEEAQKRLRADGLAQFEELRESGDGRLRRLAEDVWADHAALDARAPALADGDRVQFLVAGAGIAGLAMAVRLVQAGFPADSIRLVEAAGGLGGTWYWNRYPGLHCDIEASLYLPLLEDVGAGFVPSRRYIPGAEIRGYLELLARRYGLEDKILYRAKLDRLRWDEGRRAWAAEITARRGPRGEERHALAVEAQFAVVTAGVLTQPQVPRLGGVGLGGFGGELLHTARWDYGATGGSPADAFPALEKLRGKRVGIIGTGATAIQLVPCLADYAAELFVFQRTASAVFSRGQKDIDAAEWAGRIATGPGWYRQRLLRHAAVLTRTPGADASGFEGDEWTRQPAYSALTGDLEYAAVRPEEVPAMIARFLALDAEPRARLRARVAALVEDPDTAARLTPWYPIWCKRPTFSDTYLQTFNRPHVHLVDTDGRGVDAVTGRGLVAAPGGPEIPLDVLVLSTGYRSPAASHGNTLRAAGVEAVGRAGRTLSDKFEQQGVATLHGVASAEFPNLFWLGPAQTGVSTNYAHALDTQAAHVARIVADAHRKVGRAPPGAGAGSGSGSGSTGNSGVVVEVEPAAEEAWSMRIVAGAARFAAQSVCTPSYINNEGDLGPKDAPPEEMLKRARQAPWSGGLLSFIEELERWEAEGSLSGIDVTVA